MRSKVALGCRQPVNVHVAQRVGTGQKVLQGRQQSRAGSKCFRALRRAGTARSMRVWRCGVRVGVECGGSFNRMPSTCGQMHEPKAVQHGWRAAAAAAAAAAGATKQEDTPRFSRPGGRPERCRCSAGSWRGRCTGQGAREGCCSSRARAVAIQAAAERARTGLRASPSSAARISLTEQLAGGGRRQRSAHGHAFHVPRQRRHGNRSGALACLG